MLTSIAHSPKRAPVKQEAIERKSAMQVVPTDPSSSGSSYASSNASQRSDFVSLTKGDLRPGDILLQRDPGNDSLLSLIKFGQRMAGLHPFRRHRGKASRIHVALWTHTPGKRLRTAPFSHGETEITEARAETKSVLNSTLMPGEFEVFRPRDQELGEKAARIAQTWGEKRKIPYSRKLATLSIFRSSKFNNSAKTTAQAAAADAQAEVPIIARDGMYCSQLVTASYQAAALRANTLPPEALTGALRVNSRAVSPRMLHHLLVHDTTQFENTGRIYIRPDMVPYLETIPCKNQAT